MYFHCGLEFREETEAKHIGSAVRTGSARQQGKFLMVKDTGSAVSRDCVTLGK